MSEEEKKTITREKRPGRVAQGRKLAALMKKRKEEILYSNYSLQNSLQDSLQNSLQYSLQYNLQNSLQYSRMELMSMALKYLRSLPLVFVYFFHMRKIKNSSMKNRINHQNDVICCSKKHAINE